MGAAAEAGQQLRRRDLGPAPARPNFVLSDVTLQVRERGRRWLVFEGMSGVFPRGFNVVVLANRDAGAKPFVRLLTGLERPTRGSIARNVRMSWPISFTGYLMPDCSLRENSLFMARLYGEDTRKVATFVREVMGIRAEFELPLAKLKADFKKSFAATLALAIEFDCYILDGSVSGRDDGFVERWHLALDERLRTADVIQITNRKQRVLGCHEMGAILADGKLRFFESVQRAIDAFSERPGEIDDDADDDGDLDTEDDDRDGLL
jgi:capsular polysaccharide transport system ATP-binding protein